MKNKKKTQKNTHKKVVPLNTAKAKGGRKKGGTRTSNTRRQTAVC